MQRGYSSDDQKEYGSGFSLSNFPLDEMAVILANAISKWIFLKENDNQPASAQVFGAK